MLQVIESNRHNQYDEDMAADLPCCVLLSWNHNHDLLTAEALSYRPSTDDLKATFFSYFK